MARTLSDAERPRRPEGDSPAPVLSAENIAFGYGATAVLNGVSLQAHSGEAVALLGRNGAGKSTLLRLLSGVLAPAHGAILFRGTPLQRLSRRTLALQLAVVPQDMHVPFAFTTREVVALGRTAHVPFLHGESARDRAAVQDALSLLDLDALAERTYNSLSGGERQRAILAMALAQEPIILLLDEPTVHLDLAHQLAILRIVRALTRKQGLAVLAAVHDLNLAALLFDRLIFLADGRVVVDGPPDAVMTAETVYEVFGARVSIYRHPTAGVPQVTLLP